MAASAACLGGQDRLTVLVVDQTGVASGDIANAIDLSRGVFDILGVKTSWSVCYRGETCVTPADHFIRMSVVPWSKGTMLGFARMDSVAGGHPQAYAFYSSAQRLAKRTHHPLSLALGCVMVHEMLHLMGLEHTPYGIMRTAFDSQELASVTHNPGLSPSQLKQFRAGVSRLNAMSLAAAR